MTGLEATKDVVELAKLAREGDVRAVEALVQELSESVARQASRHIPRDAIADVVAETMFALIRNISSIRDPEAIQFWVRIITSRKCHDYWRKIYRERDALAEYTRQIERSIDLPESERDLEAALAQLGSTERLLVSLHYFEDRPIKEAAQMLGISVTNAKVRLFRIRKRLKALLTDQGEDEELKPEREKVANARAEEIAKESI